MRRLTVFNAVSLDGYFVDAHGDMSWAHRGGDDPEWAAFVRGNAESGGVLVFGRVTYELMAGYWPTAQAARADAAVAARMNALPKIVCSRTLKSAGWSNTTLIEGDIVAAMRAIKQQPGPDLVVLGSGSIVAQFAQAQLVDEFQFVVNPIALGGGRTLFEGIERPLDMRQLGYRVFRNGKVLARYAAAR